MTQSFSLPDYFAAREGVRRAFADRNGYADHGITPLYEDMASRRFYRVGNAVLMDSLPDDHAYATPGHRLSDFIRLATALRKKGIHAPEIYAADQANGLILMEDLGDTAIDGRYLDMAVDVLIRLREGFSVNECRLPDYFISHIHARHDRVVHWYAPCIRQSSNPDGWLEEYNEICLEIEKDLPRPLTGFLHADYARHNLRFIKNECGVLDFQGAHWGPLAYDLVNLLEDGRVETPPDIKQTLYHRYISDLPAGDRKAFDLWYALLSAQFHLRLSGQFIKLALHGGKPRYLDYLPLIQSYLQAELAHPLLKPLADWFAVRGIRFEGPVHPDRAFIRPDAL